MTNTENVQTRGPRVAPGAFQEDRSWQRNDLGIRGRYAGRDYYYENRTARPVGRVGRSTAPWDAARALRVGGIALIALGAAAWVWIVLTVVSSLGAGTEPDHPFSARFGGITLSSGGLVAIVAGVLLATVGSWLARAAYGRRERTRVGPDQIYWP